MRAILLATLLAAVTPAPAGACPRTATCAAIDLRPPVNLQLPKRADPVKLAFRFEIERKDPNPIPWIWLALRSKVYNRLPSYDDDARFSLTLAPVVVTSAFDTVPGLGVEGEF